tara:strand:- start:1301 stop:1564 length:264 start_codon:yes stop_codon:yes gene_type:complete
MIREKEKDMMFVPFSCHEEIDSTTADYILTVADANSIWQIPIEDINSFLEGLDEYQDEDDGQPDWAPDGDGQPDWAQEWADFGECYE